MAIDISPATFALRLNDYSTSSCNNLSTITHLKQLILTDSSHFLPPWSSGRLQMSRLLLV